MTNPDMDLAGYEFATFVLDLEWGGLFAADGTELPLRAKSLALLHLLLENAGRVLSRETIMDALWPNVFVTDNNLTQSIHEIRRVLGADACRALQTLSRRGYRLGVDVRRLSRANGPLNARLRRMLPDPAQDHAPANASCEHGDLSARQMERGRDADMPAPVILSLPTPPTGTRPF